MAHEARLGWSALLWLTTAWAATPGCGGEPAPQPAVPPLVPATTDGSCVTRGTVAPSGLSSDTVLMYGYGHRDSALSFVVRTDGTAEIATGPTGTAKTPPGAVTPDDLKALAETFRAGDCCAKRSCRSQGVPDEARPSIGLRLEKLDCTIQMWDGDFAGDAGTKACLGAVEGLYLRVREQAK
jgi:hypothetical protein